MFPSIREVYKEIYRSTGVELRGCLYIWEVNDLLDAGPHKVHYTL